MLHLRVMKKERKEVLSKEGKAARYTLLKSELNFVISYARQWGKYDGPNTAQD